MSHASYDYDYSSRQIPEVNCDPLTRATILHGMTATYLFANQQVGWSQTDRSLARKSLGMNCVKLHAVLNGFLK